MLDRVAVALHVSGALLSVAHFCSLYVIIIMYGKGLLKWDGPLKNCPDYFKSKLDRFKSGRPDLKTIPVS